MGILVRFFGQLTEITGCTEREFPLPEHTDQLQEWLWADYPDLKGMNYAMAVDKKMVQGMALRGEEREVALLPPFSGG